MNTTIRSMTKEDADQVLQMMRVFYASDAVLSNGSEEIFHADVENCINDNPYLEGYIFEGPEGIRGYAMVAKSFSTEFGKPCIWIEDLYLKDTWRNKGIGSLFFDYIQKKYPHALFRLEVEAENLPAVHTYQKNGFEVLPYMEMKK